MNADDLWKGAGECVINARNLFSCSQILYEETFYGPATSLIILSAEEAIKGMTYAYYSISELGESRELKRDLLNHGLKHELGLFYFCLNHMMTRLVQLDFYLQTRTDVTEDRKLLILNEFVEKYKNDFGINEFKEIKAASEWKDNANRIKNECLYVGQYKGHWRNPSNTSKKTYKRQKEICSYFLETAESSIIDNEADELRAFSKTLFG